MKPLESRKRLLLAESELNRAQLAGDIVSMAASASALADRAKSFGSMASAAAVLVAGVAAFQRGKPADAGSKPSRLQSFLKGAGLIGTFWLAFRSRGQGSKAEHSQVDR
jgi:hypothetical protein